MRLPGAKFVEGEWAKLGPCIMGATGGSGTRVVARIARRAGLFIGNDLNISDDALPFGDYSDHWINSYLAPKTVLERIRLRRMMTRDLRETLSKHLQPLGGNP